MSNDGKDADGFPLPGGVSTDAYTAAGARKSTLPTPSSQEPAVESFSSLPPMGALPASFLPVSGADGSFRSSAVADRPMGKSKCDGCTHMFGMLLEGATLNLREDGTSYLSKEAWCTAPQADAMISLEGRVVYACSKFTPVPENDPAASGRQEYLTVLSKRQEERDNE